MKIFQYNDPSFPIEYLYTFEFTGSIHSIKKFRENNEGIGFMIDLGKLC